MIFRCLRQFFLLFFSYFGPPFFYFIFLFFGPLFHFSHRFSIFRTAFLFFAPFFSPFPQILDYSADQPPALITPERLSPSEVLLYDTKFGDFLLYLICVPVGSAVAPLQLGGESAGILVVLQGKAEVSVNEVGLHHQSLRQAPYPSNTIERYSSSSISIWKKYEERGMSTHVYIRNNVCFNPQRRGSFEGSQNIQW